MAREVADRMRSLGGEWRRAGGRLRGAGPLRGWLVLLLVFVQGFEVSQYYAVVANSPFWIVTAFLIPALFALAGLTLAHGADERGWHRFIAKRAARVLPIVVAATLACAFVIGPIATQASLSSYFGDEQTYLFVLNAVGVYQPGLPQTFEFANAAGVVNAPLWTVGYLAIGIAILAAATRYRRRSLMILLALPGLLLVGAIVQTTLEPLVPRDVLYRAVAGQGLAALLCFSLGALAHRLRDRVKIDGRIAFVALAAVGVSAILLRGDARENGLILALVSVPVSYLVLYLATRRLAGQVLEATPRGFWTGLFLIAFPIQQLVMQVIGFGGNPFLGLIIALPGALLLALAVAAGLTRFVLPRIAWALDDGDRLQAMSAPRPLKRRSLRSHARRLWRHGPALMAAFVLLVIALAIFALLFFAAQRDNPGV